MGFELGAVDYITKPFEPQEVIARVRNHLTLKLAMDRLENQNEVLEEMVLERTRQLQLTQDVTINSLSSLAETRDNETGNHILRTQKYVEILCRQLSEKSKFRDVLNPGTIDLIMKSAPLHDMGKVGIPDSILHKPGKLSEQEFNTMKKHTVYGFEALNKAEKQLGTNTFLRHAKMLACSHHEKWDGSGYPEELKEDDIPLEGRIMAIADVYDALICKRVYKPPFSHTRAVEIILEGRGSHFDPDITDAFASKSEEFRQTALQLAEHPEEIDTLRL